MKGVLNHIIISHDEKYWVNNKTEILFINQGTAVAIINRNIVVEPGRSFEFAKHTVLKNTDVFDIQFETTGTKKLYVQAIEIDEC